MSLFQTSVIKKYLSELSPELIDKKYNEFQSYFGNPERQENIRNLKEEEFQSEFIRNLFVNIFGYTLNPEPNYNIVLEKKNVDDSKKADGAIIRNNEVIAVIELKSTQTTNLDSFRDQAFGYKNHNPKCVYVITSNFEKIRLYINDATNHEEFDLFNLKKEDFSLLWLCFSKDNILNDIPLKIKEASVLQEENVTKKLYNDYSKFRTEIFEDIVKNNTQFDKLVLFKKTQKLLDRFLFIFFAEDRLLLPPNSISEIVKQWVTLKEDLDEYVPLYDRFKKYFGYLNTGYKGKKYDIFPYNGGLFAPDEILDNVKISDELLHKHTLQLSTYDFETEVDVNILGHIFEHSLGEIENVQAEIAGEEIDRQKTKRKKDGIFYTPKYITKYIVENTVGKLCEEKRTEFGIIDEEYAKGRKNRKKEIVKELDNKLTEYREWLLNITILDPACGSGAFLNQALEFLIEEHKRIDELKAQLLGGSIVFSDIETKILEKNIYGVDLNEESVEIAKLSLWLRTAQKGRKLTTLSNHIKCGNSLIDDPEIAGEKAFNWKNEFPEVFANGGFNVVIGNPPYVDMRNMLSKDIKYFKKIYTTASDRINLFGLFVELSFNKLNKYGEFGMIIHRNLIRSNEYEKCRELILNKTELNSILSFKNGVFEGVTGEMTVLTFSKKEMINYENDVNIFNYEKTIDSSVYKSKITQSTFNKCLGKRFNVYLTKEKTKLLDKILTEHIPLGKISYTLQGIIAGDEKRFISNKKINEDYKPILRGRDIKRYSAVEPYEYIYFIEGTKVLVRSRKKENFEFPTKILTQHVSGGINAYLDQDRLYYMQTINGTIITDNEYSPKYILTLLNSKLISFYYDNVFNIGAEFTTAVAIENLDLIPIKIISLIEQTAFIDKADLMQNLNKELQIISDKFIRLVQRKFDIDKLSTKLQNWYNFSFSTFISELTKNKVKISLKDEIEWEMLFLEESKKVNILINNILKTDKEIDQMVYELYCLTEEEIKIVEENS